MAAQRKPKELPAIMTAAELRDAELAALTEAQFQSAVLRSATDLGWRVYHTRFSLGSHEGYPDLTLVRAPRFIVAELKKVGGKTTLKQADWLADCRACPGIETYLWTPHDLDAIYRVLAY